MLLSPPDADLFFKLHRSLMFYVNQQLNVLSEKAKNPDKFSGLSLDARLKVTEAWLDEIDVTQKFIDENPADFADDELDIVDSWQQHHVAGDFFIFRHLRKYTVFLSAAEESVAYGVLGLTESLEELVGTYFPIMTKTVLLPFKDKIIYDGLLHSYNVSFGSGFRRSLNESYRQAKARLGIVPSLPIEAPPMKTPQKERKRNPGSPFHGRWLIQSMTQWDRDYIDEEIRGFFEFRPDGSGSLHFGYVRGDIDYCQTSRDGKPCVEFTWDGSDELEPVHGRGWAVLKGKKLDGMLYFHQGDESGFLLKKSSVKIKSSP